VVQLRVDFGRRAKTSRRNSSGAASRESANEVDRLVSRDADDETRTHRQIESASPQRDSRFLNQVREFRGRHTMLTRDARHQAVEVRRS
jgi:hypothetical protein